MTEINASDLVLFSPPTTSVVFAAPEAMEYLKEFQEALLNYKPDATSEEGRTDINRKAKLCGTTKTKLLALGEKAMEEAKAVVEKTRKEMKEIEASFDSIRDSIKRPLDDYKAREERRVQAHKDAIAALVEAPTYGQTETSEQIQQRIDWLQNQPPRDFEEFGERYEATLEGELERAKRLFAVARKREEEAAELVRLRAIEAERQREEIARAQAERERQIVETAKREAEERAQREIAAAAEREARAKAAAQAAAREAELREAAFREREEAARLAAEAAKAEAERLAQEAAVRAVAEERAKREAEERLAQAEAARRERDNAHRKAINSEILADIMAADPTLTQQQAKVIVIALVQRQVRHVSVIY